MSIYRFPLLLFVFIFSIVTAQAAEIRKIDINTADAWALSNVLYLVGPKKAARIVDYRKKNGPYPFKSIYDLEKVRGIGPKIIEYNKDKMFVEIPKQPSSKEVPSKPQ